jgi:FkbM family methyltransferase
MTCVPSATSRDILAPIGSVRITGGIPLHPYYFIDRIVIISGCYDRPLHQFLSGYLKPGMVALDVGANIGEVAIHMSRLVRESGHVYAFEPAPSLIARLRDNVRLNLAEATISVLDCALSDSSGSRVFAFAAPDTENQGMGSLVNRDSRKLSQEVQVTTMRLDDFVRSERLDRIDLIKVDIQGGELDFLEGGVSTLTDVGPDLVMELSPTDLAASHKRPEDLLRALEKLGYESYLFDGSGVTKREVRSSDTELLSATMNVFCTKSIRPKYR